MWSFNKTVSQIISFGTVAPTVQKKQTMLKTTSSSEDKQVLATGVW